MVSLLLTAAVIAGLGRRASICIASILCVPFVDAAMAAMIQVKQALDNLHDRLHESCPVRHP